VSAGIVFFDAECGFCTGAVRMLARWDRRHALRFAPLEGETAQRLGVAGGSQDSLVYLRKGSNRPLVESLGTLSLCADLGGAWKLAALGALVPRFLRDGVYRFIARHRKEICALHNEPPDAEFVARLLP
jgi:predicted DCC family thiol-disulfide oxidoreductase YuxK